MADDPTVPAAPAAAVPAGVTPPSATAATTTASASAAPVVPAQAAKQDTESTATVTERGWDGWPTAPTPDYLIPRMGAIPVASTVHFQTVAMTGVDDALSPAAMWARLRMPLVEVSQRKSDEASNRRLVVTKAAYGDLGTEGVADVTRLLQARVHAGKLSLAVTSDNLGLDPAPGIHKSLSVEYLFDGAAAAVIVDDNQSLDIGAEPPRIDATSLYRKYLQPAPGSVADVADRLSRDGLVPTDFDPDAIYSSMEDVVNTLLGLAPEEMLDPLSHASPDATDSPAEGVILYHEQGWYGRGLALGNLLHSVALAPGEVTQIAMTHWNHVTRSTDNEEVSQSDSTAESDVQNRAISDVADSALRQHESGGSASDSVSTAAAWGVSSIDAKASLGWGSVNGTIAGTSQSSGTSHTVSSVVTRSEGDKNLAMEANQKINAITQRHAEAARTRRATVVREVSQSEDENLTTRVVANYNHMHALTMMYFEVIEVFSLRTRVVDAERVVFLPFVVRDVEELIPRFRPVLIDAANAAGRPDLADAIRHYQADATRLGDLAEQIGRLDGADGEIAALEKAGAKLVKDLETLPNRYATQRAALNDTIRDLGHKRADVIAGMLSFKDLPDVLSGFAAQALQAQLRPLDAGVTEAQVQIEALIRVEARERERLETERGDTQRLLASLKAESRRLNEAKRTLEALLDPARTGPFREHRLFFNQAVWLSLSPGEVLGLARRRKTFKGEMLCETIDPAPVAISGNYVAYRWRLNDPLQRQMFKQRFIEPYVHDPEKQLATVQADIALPTGGVFGEAVLGCGVSAEKIDLSRFWNWKDSMIPILPTGINPMTAATPTPQTLSAEPGKLDESSARLGALQDLPAPSGLSALAQTMQAQIFRDMSGQGMLQSLAEATTKVAASGEENAASIASKNLQAGLSFMSDMANKAMTVAAAPETGGTSLLGGMVASKEGGGASLLGGVLNAQGASGQGDLLSKLTGGKGGVTETVEKFGQGTAAGGREGGDSKPPANPNIPERELEDAETPSPSKP